MDKTSSARSRLNKPRRGFKGRADHPDKRRSRMNFTLDDIGRPNAADKDQQIRDFTEIRDRLVKENEQLRGDVARLLKDSVRQRDLIAAYQNQLEHSKRDSPMTTAEYLLSQWWFWIGAALVSFFTVIGVLDVIFHPFPWVALCAR